MGLWDVVTGKVARANKLTSYATEQAYALLRDAGDRGTLLAWGHALAQSVDVAIKFILLDSEYPEWREKAKDRQAVVRCACYLAYIIGDEAIDANPQWFVNDAGVDDERTQQMREDFFIIRDTMFPADEVVRASIDYWNRAAQNEESGPITAARVGIAALESTLGIEQSSETDTASDVVVTREAVRKSFTVTGGISAGISVTDSLLSYFCEPERGETLSALIAKL